MSLRGLTIEGVAGNRGIDFTSGAALHVQNCVIRRANFGIVFSPAAGTRELTVSDTVIANNLTNGINVEPTGSGGAKVVLDRVRLENNGFDGADMSATATTGSVTATVRDSVVAGNSSRGIRITNSGSGTINVMIDRTASVNNNSVGISTSVATIRIGDSIVTGSDFGLFANDGGTIETYGTNKVDGNGTDVDVTGGTITLIPHK